MVLVIFNLKFSKAACLDYLHHSQTTQKTSRKTAALKSCIEDSMFNRSCLLSAATDLANIKCFPTRTEEQSKGVPGSLAFLELRARFEDESRAEPLQ